MARQTTGAIESEAIGRERSTTGRREMNLVWVVFCFTLFSGKVVMPTTNLSDRENATQFLPIRCACDALQHRCDSDTLDYCTSNHTCFSAVVHEDGEDVYTMGCIGRLESAELNCKIGSKTMVAIKCCNKENFCNRNLVPEFEVIENPTDPHLQKFLYGLIGLITLLIVAVLILWRFIHARHKKRMTMLSVKEQMLTQGSTRIQIAPINDSTLQGLYENSCTSGSGAGIPLLAQRTVSRSIQLMEIIGKGRYGQVWRGIYQGESVAVKIFCSHAEVVWTHECEIYNTVLLRHENVLAFIAADTISRISSCTQLWLITHYHENGSLYDYLSCHTLAKEDLLRLLMTAAAGLVHLHTEIIGTQGKPAIAHRDIKSRNILVMANKQCCIADLGLALLHTQHSAQVNVGINYKVGTRRYMAPEVLSESINVSMFESFRQADVYSFGLVMWETARRCQIGGMAEDYQLPYFDSVSNDPGFEEMRRVVCTSQIRPSIPNRWSGDLTLQALCRLMKECWYINPCARLTMLRVRKSLSKISKDIEMQKT